MKTELVPITNAAVEIGISYAALRKLIKSGAVRAVYTGEQQKRARYITREEIERVQRKGV